MMSNVTKTVSIKIDARIDDILLRTAKKYGFENKAEFIKAVLCWVLLDLGELPAEDEYLCYNMRLKMKRLDDDPDMLVALANVVAKMRGLEPAQSLELVTAYADLLELVA